MDKIIVIDEIDPIERSGSIKAYNLKRPPGNSYVQDDLPTYYDYGTNSVENLEAGDVVIINTDEAKIGAYETPAQSSLSSPLSSIKKYERGISIVPRSIKLDTGVRLPLPETREPVPLPRKKQERPVHMPKSKDELPKRDQNVNRMAFVALIVGEGAIDNDRLNMFRGGSRNQISSLKESGGNFALPRLETARETTEFISAQSSLKQDAKVDVHAIVGQYYEAAACGEYATGSYAYLCAMLPPEYTVTRVTAHPDIGDHEYSIIWWKEKNEHGNETWCKNPVAVNGWAGGQARLFSDFVANPARYKDNISEEVANAPYFINRSFTQPLDPQDIHDPLGKTVSKLTPESVALLESMKSSKDIVGMTDEQMESFMHDGVVKADVATLIADNFEGVVIDGKPASEIVKDNLTGRKIRLYSAPTGLGPKLREFIDYFCPETGEKFSELCVKDHNTVIILREEWARPGADSRIAAIAALFDDNNMTSLVLKRQHSNKRFSIHPGYDKKDDQTGAVVGIDVAPKGITWDTSIKGPDHLISSFLAEQLPDTFKGTLNDMNREPWQAELPPVLLPDNGTTVVLNPKYRFLGKREIEGQDTKFTGKSSDPQDVPNYPATLEERDALYDAFVMDRSKPQGKSAKRKAGAASQSPEAGSSAQAEEAASRTSSERSLAHHPAPAAGGAVTTGPPQRRRDNRLRQNPPTVLSDAERLEAFSALSHASSSNKRRKTSHKKRGGGAGPRGN